MKKAAVYIAILYFLLTGTRAYGIQGTPVFNDIKGTFAEEAIVRLAGKGVIAGVGPGEFGPNQSITRGQFAVMLAKTLGIQPAFSSGHFFRDIAGDTAEGAYVEALAGLGIVKGNGEGFGPERPLLRQDAAVMAHRATGKGAQFFSLKDRFIDKHSISPYAVDSVAYVAGKGLMVGSEKSFFPLEQLTRAEAASLAAGLLEIRRGQALMAFPVISPEETWMRVGEARKIEPRSAGVFPAFTPVYGMDSPEISPVNPEEALIYGSQPGKGTVTVNAGYNSYIVKTEVSSSGALVKPAAQARMDSSGEEQYQLTYTIDQDVPDTAFQQTERKSNPGPAEGLASKSDTWTGFLRQQGRDITVDLKAPLDITRISLEFWHNPGWGVYLPGYIRGEVSLDGVSWYHLGYAYHGVSPSDPGPREVSLTLASAPVKARYVKVSFPVDIWVFARHLSVAGGKAGTEPEVLIHSGQDSGLAGNYMQVPNINDILLVYTGDGSASQNINLGDFLPLVGYLDKDRNYTGKMFDAMLFLPYYGMPVTRDSWAAYLEDLFTPGKQLEALDGAVERLNMLTGLQGREKVILTIPYPDAGQQNFGPLVRGQDSLCFSEKAAGAEKASRDRFRAVQWYYENVLDRWKGAGFKNLDLAGIYWYGESIEKNPGEKGLVLNTARLVRKDNLGFFWIPYFGAIGYESWRSYGFSHVFLQPNFFSDQSPPEDRMDRAAELARRYSTGVEIELDESVLHDKSYYQLFYRQLEKGRQLGFSGQVTNAYYAGHVKKTLVRAARSGDPQVRAIYDDIYRWIGGTYD